MGGGRFSVVSFGLAQSRQMRRTLDMIPKNGSHMKKFIFAALALGVCFASNAQLRKCVGPDGKVTYSDVLCANNSATRDLKLHDNTVDTSGLREEGRRIQQNEQYTSLMQNPPQECRFKSYKNNDQKGKALAEQAQAECVKGLMSGGGSAAATPAYDKWKDHYEQTTSSRQAAINRAGAADNAAAIARSNATAIQNAVNAANRNAENRTTTCKPNLMGTALECR